MFNGRILIVSDRREVIAELEPIIRAGDHLATVVDDGDEAMQLLTDGLVPDVVITDAGSGRSHQALAYVRRFKELNRSGCHVVVAEDGAPFTGPQRGQPASERFSVLPRPFRPEEARARLEEAVRQVHDDFRSLRAEVWRSMDRLRREVADARAEMVRALALTLAARDRFMHGHCERVAATCRAVALELHLPDDQVETLESAAQLHDIGKVSVPVELLQKTDPLTQDELERIRAHAGIGAGIVRGVPSLRPLAPLIEHQGTDHAELAGAIDPIDPAFLLTGILHVVDAWDAMTSERSYRTAMPRSYWEPFIRAGAGTRFHPQAVAALFRVLPD